MAYLTIKRRTRTVLEFCFGEYMYNRRLAGRQSTGFCEFCQSDHDCKRQLKHPHPAVEYRQICSLATPYAGFSTKMHSERVVKQGYRPKPDTTWPSTWVDLMQNCWTRDLKIRPEFSAIAQTLEEQVYLWQAEEGVVPSRGSEIRAKRRKKAIKSDRLDVDTRLGTNEDVTAQRSDGQVV